MMEAAFHIFPIVTVLCYLASASAYVLVLRPEGQVKEAWGTVFLSVGFLCHAAFLLFHHLGVFTPPPVSADVAATFPDTLALISFFLVLLFLLLRRRLQIAALGAAVAPLASFFLVASGLLFHFDRPGSQAQVPSDSLLWLHIALTVLGHVAFIFAFGVSVVLIVQESMLKNKRFTNLQRKLPSLRLLDSLNGRLLLAGFLCMLSGVMAGFIIGVVHDIRFFNFNLRLVWSFLTLLVYAVLVMARQLRGFRGRRAAWLSVAGFCTVLASFLSVTFVEGGFHGF